ncbi:MAG: precorrin-2 C(20)-methyltransferase [Deltaproteobacteria bacterium]|nr:precorrin-2 C(20)-methyltransferase [Deltaproteobacteria bacterium]
MNYGTLYGVGVGPGDPELITLKAVKILRHVAVVFAAASTRNHYSLAVEIASPHLDRGVPVAHLGFPMTRDKKVLADAWAENSRKVVETLKDGNDAAFITLGDPLIYSTFGYILEAVRKAHPEIPIKIIPGITSYQAGAAATGQILVEGEGSFAVTTGIGGGGSLKQWVDHADSVVMLKVYRHYKEILDTLNELDLTDNSVLVSRCGMDGEEIVWNLKDRDDTPPHYMSHLIIRKKRWISSP